MNRLLPRLTLFSLLLTLLISSLGFCKTTIHITEAIALESRALVYSGKILGNSKKARHICLAVDLGKEIQIIPIDFTANTRGLEYAVKGEEVLINYTKRDNRIYALAIKPKLAQPPSGVKALSVDDLKGFIDRQENFTLVDSRPAAAFSPSHLPGAISIPSAQLEDRLDILPADKGAMVIFYGQGPTSASSTRSALLAVNAGYTNVYVMLEGATSWVEEGYPTYADDRFILQQNKVLVDLSREEQDTLSRIPGSVSMPFDELRDTIDEIPTIAPVVLYGDDEGEVVEAMEFFLDEGYTSVALVQGGLQQWQKGGGKVIGGPPLKDVLWKREPASGEVTVKDFTSGLTDPEQTIILDVRERRELTRGKFPQSYNLPLSELNSRMDTFFPEIGNRAKQKKVFIHCATGDRAEMAYRELKQEGYDAAYLNAMVICKADDCRIIE